MRILFDHSVPRPLKHYLLSHHVTEARELAWDELESGDLLREAEHSGFEVLITADKGMEHQINPKGRKIAIIILGHAQWPALRPNVDQVLAALVTTHPGTCRRIEIPAPEHRQRRHGMPDQESD